MGERLVDYLLAAEFDIDKGSCLRLGYPAVPPDYEDSFFAEIMLPEGAHNHPEDTTYFFLNRPSSVADAAPPHPRSAAPPPPAVSSSSTGAPRGFLHCLNLVRTKLDASVRRGAVVKAIAVCSRFPFVHIFKPMLSRALHEYFLAASAADGRALLERLYNALNAVDICSMPRYGEVDRRLLSRGGAVSGDFTVPPPAWASACDSAAVSTPSASSSTPHLAAGTAPLPRPYAAPLARHFSARCVWGKELVPLVLPLATGPDEVGEPSLPDLLHCFGGHGTMAILDAVLCERRVLLLSHMKSPAGSVCDAVLSVVQLVCPPLAGVLATRAFPYANLNNLDFLSVPGFIAGVTNPMFEKKSSWWDVLCALDAGTVLDAADTAGAGGGGGGAALAAGAPGAEASAAQPTHVAADADFAAEVAAGLVAGFGEGWARGRFVWYTQRIVDAAFDQADFGSADEAAAWMAAHGDRVARFRKTLAWKRLAADRARARAPPGPAAGTADCPAGFCLREADANFVRLLKVRRDIPAEAAEKGFAELYAACAASASDARANYALRDLAGRMPEAEHGVQPLALGLLHPSPRTREHAALLLSLLDAHAETKPAVASLNEFLRRTWQRVLKESLGS